MDKWSMFGKRPVDLSMSTSTSGSVSLINTLNSSHDPLILNQVLSQVLRQLESSSLELESVLPPVLRLLASRDVGIKRLCIEIVKMADKDTSYMALNVLLNDLKDPNPELRITAVNALCTLEALVPSHAVEAIHVAVKDNQPSVRKAGVTGCGKVFRTHSDLVKEHNLIDLLYNQIRDVDPTVVTFTVQTLNFILDSEGGVVINRKIAKHLMQKFNTFKESELCFMLDTFVTQLRIESDEELEESLLNALHVYIDDKKDRASGPVFLSAAKLFKKLVEDKAKEKDQTLDNFQLMNDFASHISPRLQRLLRSKQSLEHNSAFLMMLLDFISSFHGGVIAKFPSLMVDLQPRSVDSKQIALKKLSVLTQIVVYQTEENGALAEVRQDNFKLVWTHFVSACDQVSSDKDHYWDLLIKLAKSEMSLRLSLISQVFKAILLKTNQELMLIALVKVDQLLSNNECVSKIDQKELEEVFDILFMHVFEMEKSNEFQHSFLWILGHFTKQLSNAPYYLEHLVFEECIKIDVDLVFVAAKVFVQYPLETQHTLAQVLSDGKKSEEPALIDKCKFYETRLQDEAFVDHLRGENVNFDLDLINDS